MTSDRIMHKCKARKARLSPTDGHHAQRVHARLRVVLPLLDEPGVDHVYDSIHRHRRFRDVGGDHHFAAAGRRWPEDPNLDRQEKVSVKRHTADSWRRQPEDPNVERQNKVSLERDTANDMAVAKGRCEPRPIKSKSRGTHKDVKIVGQNIQELSG